MAICKMGSKVIFLSSKSGQPGRNDQNYKFCMGKIAKMDMYARSKMKIVVWVLQSDAAGFFFIR
jgi:hypothetical protein